MRITLIVLWWITVALMIYQFLVSKTPYSGMDFYLHSVTSVLIFMAGPIGLHTNVRALYYGGYMALVVEWFWKISFLSDLLKIEGSSVFSSTIYAVWLLILLMISVILILGIILLFSEKSPLNIGKHLLSVSHEPIRLIRNSMIAVLVVTGLFVYFNIRMLEFILTAQDWIKLAVFTLILVFWIIGAANSRPPIILCSFYISLGAFLFFAATSVSFTYSAVALVLRYGFSDTITGSSYYHAFLASAVYLLAGSPLFIRMIMKLHSATTNEQQLDQF